MKCTPRPRPVRAFAVLLSVAALSLSRAAPAAGSGPGCIIQGEAPMGSSTQVYDQATGGKPIARFTGAEVKLTVTQFPESGGHRARVSTSPFRLDGFVTASEIPVFTARDIPVHPGHLWIAGQRRVEILAAAKGKLHIQKKVHYPLQQTFQAWTPCETLTLTPGTPTGWAPNGNALGYVVKKDRLELFESPAGSSVAALSRATESPGLLLWSTHRHGAWVHVEYHGDVILDAWARAGDLSVLPPGETMDQLASASSQRGVPRLRVQGEPRVVKTSGKATLRTAGSETGQEIGQIELGAEIYVLDVVAGWASVLPKTLNVAPPDGGQFWAKATELGL